MIERTFLKSRSRSTQTLTTHGVIWEIKTAVVSKGQPDCPRWVVCLSREEKARRHPCGHGVTGLPLWGGLFPKGQRERQETPRASPPQCPAGGWTPGDSRCKVHEGLAPY